ncbi:NUDIX domain-containing protein [Halobaculum halobium]|uniref:NUDIX domain-containing protein n=1 Tax=Halobaculum halobium TaxID=3032281 RepID=A0ABD5TBG9_9EURY|nr:NUDIX domain-containing protein [Halobaculum sp. SYNS20]
MSYTVETATVSYCPSCGASLNARKTHEGERPYCPDCDLTLYRNPVPMARATVVDRDAALLIEMGEGRDEGAWALPGGHCLHDEPPRATAARELAEETGLAVDPSDLTLIGDGHLSFPDGAPMVSFNYAAATADATGTVAAADDAADARFWTRTEIEESPPLLRASGTKQVLDAIARFRTDG